jgi:cellulose synthase/poly-beta-1,6-N-acetylglucosamine synthase-like glycosyltransferase
LTFIPDAKAFTDAPERLLVLMKQRRRWMNGSLFAATRVLANMTAMLGCGRKSKQPYYRRVGVFFLMLYYLAN